MATRAKAASPAKASATSKAVPRGSPAAKAKETPGGRPKPAAQAKARASGKPAVKSVAAPRMHAKTAATKKSVPAAAAQTAKSPRPKVSEEQRRNYIEVAAYYIAERRGFFGASALEDWAQAEAEVDRMLREGKLNQ